jgi:hypothetical protein
LRQPNLFINTFESLEEKIMLKRIQFGVFVLLLSVLSVAQASEADPYEWCRYQTGDWDTVYWEYDEFPGQPAPPAGPNDFALLFDSNIVITHDAHPLNLSVGFLMNSKLTVMPGGSVSVVWSLMVGHNEGVGTLDLYGSAYGRWVRVGNNEKGARGTVNVYSGGKLTSGDLGEGCGIGNDTGWGYVYLKGTGSMDVNSLVNNSYGDPVFIRDTGHLDIEAGKLRVKGDQVSQLSDYIVNGKITGYNGKGTVNTPVLGTDEDDGWTVVTAEPAPGTCAGQGVYLPSDLTQDCYVNFADFAIFAGNWLTCNDPQNSACQ